METARRLILENKIGQAVRAFSVEADEVNLIYRHDTRRVEVHADLSDFDEQEIGYDVLKKLKVSSLDRSSISIGDVGTLRAADQGESLTSPAHELTEENDDQILTVYLKKTAIGHAAAVAGLVIVTLVTGYFAQKANEPELVTIVVPEKKEVEPKQKVQVSEEKIVQQKVQAKKVVSRPVPKPKVSTRKVVQKLPTRNKHPFAVKNAPQRNLERVGALAALGGLKNGTRGYEGLDAKSLKNIRSAGTGSGGGGIGDSGAGGIRGMMPGSGLIAGSAGGGGRAESAGGYGTRGSGGGRAGYGKISLVGGTSGVSIPLEDEAVVQGGLDRDQIAAVINRNKGQIIYCYEQGLQGQPDLRGRVSVSFVINGKGRISVASVAQSSLRSKQVENCMVAKMRNWQFPRPVGNVNVDVLYPFDLRRVSSR